MPPKSRHDVGHPVDRPDDLRHARAGRLDEPPLPARSTDASINLMSSRPRRCVARASGLRRDDGEPAPLLAGPRGFHRGVERENVGLERDAFDDDGDVGDPHRPVEICRIVSTTACTAGRRVRSPPSPWPTSAFAWRALSAFCLTVDVICSMLAAVSCSDAACCSVRCDRSRLPCAISPVPVAIEWVVVWISAMVSVSAPSCRPARRAGCRARRAPYRTARPVRRRRCGWRSASHARSPACA